MNPSLEFLERSAARTGFQIPTLEKVVRLGELAGDIVRHPLLSQVLTLKGGTALNLCFGPPKRLSVDLDFNYIGYPGREEMIAQRTEVHDAVLRVVQQLGYRSQESAEGFSGGKIFLAYRSVFGTPDRIELDLNYLYRVPFSGVSVMELWQPDELDRPSVRVVGLTELLIGKLLAFLDRAALRDVWDVANLPAEANVLLRTDSFRKLFIGFSAVLPHPLTTYTLARLQRSVTQKAIADQLTPMLGADTVLSGKDLISRAWRIIEGFLDLDAAEQEYLRLIERGEAQTTLLFPEDSDIAARIASHPAIQWKIKNVRELRNRNTYERE